MKLVLCHGVFDLLHIGHVRHLEQARAFGDRLIVSVVPDKYVAASKRPTIYNEDERVALLQALRCVDDVRLCGAPGPELFIGALRPDFYVRGKDYEGRQMPESDLLESLGIQIRYTDSVPPHTSEIIERMMATHKKGAL